jgi:hypothetical protein
MTLEDNLGTLRTYRNRLGLYAGSTLLFSMLGSTFTWRATSSWVDANPLVSGPLAILSLLPPLAILATMDVRWPGALGIAAAAATAILTFWWTFATSGSSTAVFVFYWGWVAGIPLAIAVRQLAAITKRRSTRPVAR